MRYGFLSLALLGNLALSSAAAIPKRGLVSDILEVLGVLTGANADSSSAGKAAWIGNDGDYVAEFENTSGEQVEIIVWGPAASWVNVNVPLITQTLASGSSFNVSVASGTSGGWAAIFSDTTLVDGQVSDTWGEFTFDGEYSTFDVSRLVNMNGHNMSIAATDCVSDMTTCVFTCDSGDSCEFDYSLENCATDSQKGAEYGTYDGAASGGCLVGSSNNYVKTTIS